MWQLAFKGSGKRQILTRVVLFSQVLSQPRIQMNSSHKKAFLEKEMKLPDLMWTLWIRLEHLPNVQLKSFMFHQVLLQVNWAWILKAFWPKKVKLPDFARYIFAVQHQSACWDSSCFGIRNVYHNLCPEAELAHNPQMFTWMQLWIPLGAHGFL